MPESSSSGKGPLGQVPHQVPHVYHPSNKQDSKGKGDKDRKRKDLEWDAEKVRALHNSADTDSGAQAKHHSLGPGNNQAAPGDHSHRLIGLWLYKDTDGSHNSAGNYVDTSFQAYKFWDKEFYAKIDSQTFVVLKEHVADITARVTFAANATGKRGVRIMEDGAVTQTAENLSTATDPYRAWDFMMGIQMSVGHQWKIQSFQNSGGNLTINNGRHITFFKVVRRHPQKIDSAGLATTIVPQIPGPQIASRKFVINGAW